MSHSPWIPNKTETALIDELKAADAGDMVVICGGVIPEQDHAMLRELGVAAIYGPGTNIPVAAREVLQIVRERHAAEAGPGEGAGGDGGHPTAKAEGDTRVCVVHLGGVVEEPGGTPNLAGADGSGLGSRGQGRKHLHGDRAVVAIRQRALQTLPEILARAGRVESCPA